MTVIFPRSTIFFIACITDIAEKESSPEVGSSRKRICGLAMSSNPMLVRFRSPPDIPWWLKSPTTESEMWLKFNLASVSSTIQAISFNEVLRLSRKRPAKYKFSLTVKSEYNVSSYEGGISGTSKCCDKLRHVHNLTCGTNPTHKSSQVGPSQKIFPDTLPLILQPRNTFNIVVFPLPEEPWKCVEERTLSWLSWDKDVLEKPHHDCSHPACLKDSWNIVQY